MKKLIEFTEKYTKIFFDGLDFLNIKRATIYPRATETIPQMIELIKKLEENGFAYERNDGVYYNISKFKDYGKLSKIDLSNIRAGARVNVDEYDKENPGDFALWKKSTPEEIKRGIYYESPWGRGRPGWHIECSTMSTYYLGETIDIHIGGVDLIFPHHENEIAQSEGATGKQFVRYWVHGEHLLVNKSKMSKSKGNFYTLKDLKDMGFDLLALRFLYLKTHYRTQMNFTLENLKQAQETLENLRDFMRRIRAWNSDAEDNPRVKELVKKIKQDFESKMDDDLNTPEALAFMFLFVKEINKLMDSGKLSKNDAKLVYDTMMKIDEVFGILKAEDEYDIPEEAKRLIEEREAFRKEKNFQKADQIRDELREKYGILLEDTPQGPRWKVIKKK